MFKTIFFKYPNCFTFLKKLFQIKNTFQIKKNTYYLRSVILNCLFFKSSVDIFISLLYFVNFPAEAVAVATEWQWKGRQWFCVCCGLVNSGLREGTKWNQSTWKYHGTSMRRLCRETQVWTWKWNYYFLHKKTNQWGSKTADFPSCYIVPVASFPKTKSLWAEIQGTSR